MIPDKGVITMPVNRYTGLMYAPTSALVQPISEHGNPRHHAGIDHVAEADAYTEHDERLVLQGNAKGFLQAHLVFFGVFRLGRSLRQSHGKHHEQQRHHAHHDERRAPADALRQDARYGRPNGEAHGHGGVVQPDHRAPAGLFGPARQHGYGHRGIAGVAHADHEPAKQNEEEVRDEPAQQTAYSPQAGHEGDGFFLGRFVRDKGERQHEQGHTAKHGGTGHADLGVGQPEGFLHGGEHGSHAEARREVKQEQHVQDDKGEHETGAADRNGRFFHGSLDRGRLGGLGHGRILLFVRERSPRLKEDGAGG